MYPYLFSLGPFVIHSYGVTMALGFLAAGIVTYLGFKRKGIGDTETVTWLVLIAALGGVLGAKLDYILVNMGEVSGDPAAIFSGAGLIWYGGVVGGVALSLVYAHLKKIPKAKAFDAIAPAFAIGLGFGRIGCFLMGTCYGKPSTLPWAVAFTDGLIPTPPGVTVQPTQLYEAIASFAIFGLLMYLRPRLNRDWAMISAYAALAGATRLAIEFLRFSRDGQIQAKAIALMIALTGLAALVVVMRRPAVDDRPVLLAKS